MKKEPLLCLYFMCNYAGTLPEWYGWFSVDKRVSELSGKYYDVMCCISGILGLGDALRKMMRKLNKGLTFVEVMAALVIALVIAIGVMSYQYAGAQHARKTDVRVTGSRIGLLFLESWVAAGGIDDVGIYDPADKLGLGVGPPFPPPFPPGNIVSDVDLSAVPGLGTTFRSYGVFTNGTWFWIKMSYDEEPGVGNSIRELGVSIAWSLDFGSPALVFDPGSTNDLQRLIRFSKSVIYVPPT